MVDRKKFFIIDGHALIYRSYFAFVNNHRANKDGLITSAPFGFVNSLFELFKKENPDYIAVAFDTKYKTWRHEQLTDYKANRPKQPEDITKSFPYIFSILDGFNINRYSLEGFEADDVIGTMTKKIPDDIDVFIMTSDKDYGQLVKENVYLYKPNNTGYLKLGIQDILQKWDIHEINQVIDMLAIIGDKCDNVPGVRGVGEKTAAKLLKQYGSLENILENIQTLKGSIKDKFEKDLETVKLSKKLVTIITDCNVDFKYSDCTIKTPNFKKLNDVFDELEFKNFKDKLNIFNKEQSLSLF